MNKFKFLCTAILMQLAFSASAQTLYVDAAKGKDVAAGTADAPLLSIEKAVVLVNSLGSKQSVTIKLAPGLYIIHHPLKIESADSTGAAPYSIEAAIMPGDTAWTPARMPVIQSVADTNRGTVKFRYCVAVQVERDNVAIKGIKFTGNATPGLQYYYAIERHEPKRDGLTISQCYFTAEKSFAPMQGAIYAQGANIHIDHCIFYDCKNAVLVFLGLKDFSLTHSIIYGAYEGAFWYGYGEGSNAPFTFSNNVISNCNYVCVSEKEHPHQYTFTNSVISGNKSFMGLNEKGAPGPDLQNKPVKVDIDDKGKVLLNEITAEGIPRDYLNLSSASAGYQLKAGVFKDK